MNDWRGSLSLINVTLILCDFDATIGYIWYGREEDCLFKWRYFGDYKGLVHGMKLNFPVISANLVRNVQRGTGEE
jgi:hypothetical protein